MDFVSVCEAGEDATKYSVISESSSSVLVRAVNPVSNDTISNAAMSRSVEPSATARLPVAGASAGAVAVLRLTLGSVVSSTTSSTGADHLPATNQRLSRPQP